MPDVIHLFPSSFFHPGDIREIVLNDRVRLIKQSRGREDVNDDVDDGADHSIPISSLHSFEVQSFETNSFHFLSLFILSFISISSPPLFYFNLDMNASDAQNLQK